MRRERHPSKQRTPGHFWIVLAGICTVGLVLRLLIVGEYVAENPLAKTLLVDAAVYWAWAARVADGVLVQDTPFFSAPLYPYLLGLARRLGASLATVYTAQALMDVATAGVLGWAGFKRFGTTTGLLAAGAFLALREPASFSLRVLTCSLQLLLLAVVYRQLVVVQATPTLWRRLILGLVLGLLCLAYPPAMLLVVAVGPWLFWQSARRPRDAWPAAGVVGVAALVIAPATVHNWYVTGGDLFFIQSATAINLRQGNQPRSNGGYTAIPGTSAGRGELFEDVARQYETST
ncbi:MAG: hypothetical protein GY842_04805, partial [bacterium]|nr:hypothetical protein [bacterium]